MAGLMHFGICFELPKAASPVPRVPGLRPVRGPKDRVFELKMPKILLDIWLEGPDIKQYFGPGVYFLLLL